jgi:putative sterol carrier protein
MAQTSSIYTKRLGRNVAKQAKGTIGKYHIIPAQTNKWNIVAEGSLRPFKAFTSKDKAVRFAKKYVISVNAGQVIIHGLEGKILGQISY